MKLYLTFILLMFFSGSFAQTAENNVPSCDRLFASAKSPDEKAELKKDYWTLLGILNDLSHYRQIFQKDNREINLFPTVYYFTTVQEMQRIADLQFHYPAEKMEQMIAFYDAYKYNRMAWDQGRKAQVEPHWALHFASCGASSDDDHVCFRAGVVLASAIQAHVECDLPRAMRYASAHRFDKAVVYADLLSDFSLTNDLFPISERSATDQLKSACSDFWIDVLKDNLDVINGFLEAHPDLYKAYGVTKILSSDDVIYLRQQAWLLAFSSKPIVGFQGQVLNNQPVLDHGTLIAFGRNVCPSNDSPPTSVAPQLGNRKGLTGGATPEALGRLMLKAIKTNNKALWNSCIHPVFEKPEIISDSFERVRDRLEEAGVTDWNSLTFSRVTFLRNLGGNDNGVYQAGIHPGDAEFKGEQIRRAYNIEFTYRNGEFVGQMGDICIMTYHHGNYLMLNPSGAYLNRVR